MTGWLLDTNIVSELLRDSPDEPVQAWAAATDLASAFISILTLAEYDKGIAHLPPLDSGRLRYAGVRDRVEAIYRRRTLPLTDAIVRRWGVLAGDIKRVTGHSPQTVDIMLAATAIEHRLTLVTRNTKDVQHSGATLLNPWFA